MIISNFPVCWGMSCPRKGEKPDGGKVRRDPSTSSGWQASSPSFQLFERGFDSVIPEIGMGEWDCKVTPVILILMFSFFYASSTGNRMILKKSMWLLSWDIGTLVLCTCYISFYRRTHSITLMSLLKNLIITLFDKELL